MKKIIPFIVFIPLLFLSIYLGYTQYANRKANKGANINANMSGNKEANSNTNTGAKSNTNEPTQILPSIAPTSSPSSSPAVSQINLVISTPESGIITDTSSIVVSGTTKPKIDIVVNDKDLVSGEDGSFNISVSLDEGDNYISIVAYDEEGNVAEREIMITRATSDI
jgi:hypothetical protein